MIYINYLDEKRNLIVKRNKYEDKSINILNIEKKKLKDLSL